MTVARLNPQPGETIVDCAGGTGDIARRVIELSRKAQMRRGGDDASVVIVDYNAEMVAAGRAKSDAPPGDLGCGRRPEASASRPLRGRLCHRFRNSQRHRHPRSASRGAARSQTRGPLFVPGVLSAVCARASIGVRRLFLRSDSEDRRAGPKRPGVLSVPDREHSPISRSNDISANDHRRRLRARELHQLHRRRRSASSRLGGLDL